MKLAGTRNSEHNQHSKRTLFLPKNLRGSHASGGDRLSVPAPMGKVQSENDIESHAEIKDRENFLVSNVTFGITILRSRHFEPPFIRLMSDLYHQEERRRKEEEEERRRKEEELKRKQKEEEERKRKEEE